MAGTLIDRRIRLLLGLFGVCLAAALGRALWLGTLQAPSLKHAALTQQVQKIDVPARRGEITDRHGVPLAISQPADDIAATPYLIKQKLAVANKLAPLLQRPATDVLKDLSRPGGFVYLARLMPAAQAAKIQNLHIEGISLIPQVTREYPRGTLAAQVLGTVGTDDHGLFGLELGAEKLLHGTNGVRNVVNDALGQPIAIRDSTPEVPGRNITTTLDATLQDQVEQVLGGVAAQYSPKSATAIVMDPRTGDVLALANWPPADASRLGSAPAAAQQDHAIGYTYEPGSTFKAITVSAALSEHLVTPRTQFDLPVEIQVADRRIHDAEARGPERLTVARILAQSSNVGAVMIGLRLGATKFDHWVHKFGFGRPTGIALPGEERGIVLHHQQYSGSSMGNMPIGQGESVTPIQMATAYSAIANGGILRPPRLIRAIDGQPVPVAHGRRILRRKVAASVRRMLEGVLGEGGTAHDAAIPGYSLAGKTGTANKVDPRGGYSDTKYVASFVGFAPAENPKLLVAVMVDEPQGAIYGGVVAAPAFQKIIGFALPYLGIRPR